MAQSSAPRREPSRGARVGFRVDEKTKALVERAARLEHRSVTDYCLTALTEAAQHTIARHETLVLSDAERAAFFDVLVSQAAPNDRLRRAFEAERQRVVG